MSLFSDEATSSGTPISHRWTRFEWSLAQLKSNASAEDESNFVWLTEFDLPWIPIQHKCYIHINYCQLRKYVLSTGPNKYSITIKDFPYLHFHSHEHRAWDLSFHRTIHLRAAPLGDVSLHTPGTILVSAFQPRKTRAQLSRRPSIWTTGLTWRIFGAG